tara:strand:- start:758 stop:1297 length:540 start_codon:yes stop_codon:yes gene_type:complete
MFTILMTKVHINLSDCLLNNLLEYYNENISSLIHIYKHGICITQNINKTTNISFYINQEDCESYQINSEVAFYNKENLRKLKEIKIISDNNDNFIYLDDQLNKIKFITSCNFCKNIQEIQFIETKIPQDLLEEIDFGWMQNKVSLFKGDSQILLSDQINGMIIKINEINFTIYLNSLAD